MALLIAALLAACSSRQGGAGIPPSTMEKTKMSGDDLDGAFDASGQLVITDEVGRRFAVDVATRQARLLP